MSETAQLITLIQQQMAAQQKQHQEQMQMQMAAQQKQHQEQMQTLQDQNQKLLAALTTSTQSGGNTVVTIPSFTPFDSSNELWSDYWARFITFTGVHSIPEAKQAQVFLTNQTSVTYKLLSNYASQLTPSKDINQMSIAEIVDYMKTQFDPTRYIVRERYKFWSDLKRKPGETIPELAARIRQDAVTCDFTTIKDPQDEALRTRFICSVNNEAILKAFFRMKDDELTFAKAVAVAQETEDAARVTKETVHGPKHTEVHHIAKKKPHRADSNTHKATQKENKDNKLFSFPKGTCGRCGTKNHTGSECPYVNATCNHCKRKGHIESACLKKKRGISPNTIKVIYTRRPEVSSVKTVNTISLVPQIEQPITLNEQTVLFEVDTGAGENFCSQQVWEELGKPPLNTTPHGYVGATGDSLPVLGTFKAAVTIPGQSTNDQKTLQFNVVELNLNLLGRDGILKLNLDITSLINTSYADAISHPVNTVFDTLKPDKKLQEACEKLCEDYPNLFKQELGCLRDFELEVKFKDNAKPVFCKPRRVPFAIQEDLNHAIDANNNKNVLIIIIKCFI